MARSLVRLGTHGALLVLASTLALTPNADAQTRTGDIFNVPTTKSTGTTTPYALPAGKNKGLPAWDLDEFNIPAVVKYQQLIGRRVQEKTLPDGTVFEIEALTKDMLGLAALMPQEPEVQAILYIQAYQLGLQHKDGLANANKALNQLLAQYKAYDVLSLEKNLPLLEQKILSSQPGPGRTENQHLYLGYLEGAIKAREGVKDTAKAVQILTKALNNPWMRKGPSASWQKELQRLEAVAAKELRDAPLALSYSDFPALTRATFQDVFGTDLTEALKDSDKMTALIEEMLKTGATLEADRPLQALVYLQVAEFTERYARLDLGELGIKAMQRLMAGQPPYRPIAERRIAAIKNAVEDVAPPGTGLVGENLLAKLDVAQHTVRGVWSLKKRLLEILPGEDAQGAMIQFPLAPETANYTIEMDVTLQKAGDLVVVLPLGRFQLTAAVLPDGAALSRVDGKLLRYENLTPQQRRDLDALLLPAFRDGKPARVTIAVKPAATGVGVQISVNGNEILSWEGATNTLSSTFADLIDKRAFAVGTRQGTIKIHRAVLKAGEAKPLDLKIPHP